MIDEMLTSLKNIIDYIPIPVRAGMLSFVLVLLRIAYAKEEKRWLRRIIEGGICCTLTITAGYTATAFGFNEVLAYGIGSYIAWYGADHTAQMAKKKVDSLINKEGEK